MAFKDSVGSLDRIAAALEGIAEGGGGGGGGGGSGALFVNFVFEDEYVTVDKTWQEIFDAFESGEVYLCSIFDDVVSRYPVVRSGVYGESASGTIYGVTALGVGEGEQGEAIPRYEVLTTNSTDGYPQMDYDD